MGRPRNTSADFWRFVRKTDGCWEWIGGTSRGYGIFKLNNKSYRAPRFAWRLLIGEVPSGLFVLHSCDNRACVNPDHLFLGTHDDNMLDMVQKGRATGCPLRGEEASNAKLTNDQVLAIRAKKEAGMTYRPLCRLFGITYNTAWCIVNRRTWAHI